MLYFTVNPILRPCNSDVPGSWSCDMKSFAQSDDLTTPLLCQTSGQRKSNLASVYGYCSLAFKPVEELCDKCVHLVQFNLEVSISRSCSILL